MRCPKHIKLLFILSASCVFFFGLLVQLLQSRLGSCLDGWPVVFTPAVASRYMDCLLLGILVTGAVFLLSREKFLAGILSFALAVCVLIPGTLLVSTAFLAQDDTTTISSGQVISRSEEASALRHHSVFRGRGDRYFKTVFRSPAEEEAQENRLYFAFRSWRSDAQLPVLSYCYGWWIILWAILTALLWSVCTVWGYDWVSCKFPYLVFTLSLALQLWGPIADYFGLFSWTLPIPFATSDPFCWGFLWTIPLLGTLLTLSTN